MENKLSNISNVLLDSKPRNEWGEFLDGLNLRSGELSEMSDYLTNRATLLAELAEYLDNRGGNGCGDSGHENAMKKAQKERKRIRKALGYSYP